jgi:hypothetical protein
MVSFCTPAPETDNFYLPPKPEFADFGDFLEAVHTRALEEGVRQVNSRIEGALNLKNAAARTKQLERYHWPDAVATAVADQFGTTMTEILEVDHALGAAWARRTFPHKTLDYSNISMNFCGHFPLDPRALLMLDQAGTVRAFGIYFGTDKILHFHQLGFDYYRRYRALLRMGTSPDQALQKVLSHFSNDGLLSESKVYGSLCTGVYSNADLASDYAGFKFYLNLTELVRLLGEDRQPLVVRCGVFWRVTDQVRPQSGWFRAFISDHWNEALNPCLYDWTMRPFIRKTLQRRAERIVSFYTCNDGRPNDPAYFDNLAHTLATYFGEPYGHSGSFEKLMNIGNTCFPALKEGAAR